MNHMQQASETVKVWPSWKRRALGGYFNTHWSKVCLDGKHVELTVRDKHGKVIWRRFDRITEKDSS